MKRGKKDRERGKEKGRTENGKKKCRVTKLDKVEEKGEKFIIWMMVEQNGTGQERRPRGMREYGQDVYILALYMNHLHPKATGV